MEVEDGSLKPMQFRLQPINENFDHMVVDGFSDDESEEYVEMTYKEMQDYIRKKMLEYRKMSENPLIKLEQQNLELIAKIKEKKGKVKELQKSMAFCLKNEIRFYLILGVLPKITTRSIGVSTNLSNNQIHSFKTIVIDYIDLTDEPEGSESDIQMEHPAPFPACFYTHPSKDFLEIPVKPFVKVCVTEKGILLSWNIPSISTFNYMHVEGFELFRYQVTSNVLPSSLFWRQIGFMKAQPLPMRCNVGVFKPEFTYFFAVRASDVHGEHGEFSSPVCLRPP
ncbi:hypothetical protein CEXT_590431 [Caerostris extrusa]|uniref:Fibronectin type-III domain-containing protein n=1 Tax=Caerostris extrusa TaxID=172846 RepID=A0AAV4SU50_CAEEX|nr:hypothetical protein CEXT_590431 [Caerostris extrusa]